MLFNSLTYLIFLPIVVAVFWLSPRRFRTGILLVASYVFYMSWKPIYGLLIFGLTAVNYLLGRAIHARPSSRTQLLVLAVAINLIALGFFKYTYYSLELLNQLLVPWAMHIAPPPFEIILPLGISFFVFEFIHYVVDIYRGAPPVRSFWDFSLFASFFPTQLAGPIKRFQDFVPQLKFTSRLTLEDFDSGLWLILFGLFKKVLFADNLAVVVQSGFSHPELLSVSDVWIVVYAFAFQIYFDFSGYTDIARGSAQLLGFKVPINFNLPYLSGSVQEFWHRWHISLSTWLRDYLFIPLGGSRGSKWLVYRNLFLTMLLGGLWHGAGTHFLAWGAFHGIALIAHKVFRQAIDRFSWSEAWHRSRLYHAGAVVLTFHVVCIGWVFFRADSMNIVQQMLEKMFLLDRAAQLSPTLFNLEDPPIFIGLPVILLTLLSGQMLSGWLAARSSPLVAPVPVKALGVAAMLAVLLIFSPDTSPKFIYFQF